MRSLGSDLLFWALDLMVELGFCRLGSLESEARSKLVDFFCRGSEKVKKVKYLQRKMALEITQVLLSAQSPDANVRNKAETTLGQLRYQNLTGFLQSLAVELSNDGKPTNTRILAGIVLKNFLDAKDYSRWMAIDNSLKSQIKTSLLNTLGSSVREASHTAAQVVSKIASIEVPEDEWPELFELLLANMTKPDSSAFLKQATLETLGYVCEEISREDLLDGEVEDILAAVTRGMDVSKQNTEVCVAATRALYYFLGTDHSKLSMSSYIEKVIYYAVKIKETKIREAVFGGLVSIASTYYEVLEPYMTTILELTTNVVKGNEEVVALLAIEFWIAICDKEMEIQDYEVPHYHFIQNALSPLVHMLLETLLKQDEDQYKDQDQEDEIWNLAMAGGTCLCLVARIVGDAVVPLVMPFVELNMSKSDWQSQEAARYAFGSILEGPNIKNLLPMVNDVLDFLLNAMEDHDTHVKNTTAWALSRIFELVHSPATGFSVITSDNLQRIIHILLKSLQDAPHVAKKVCGAIYFLAKGYEKASPISLLLMPYLPDILRNLIITAERKGSTNSKLRSSAYKTLDKVVMCLNLPETSEIIVKHLFVIMSKLEQTLNPQILSSDDRKKQGHVQASLCVVLQVIIVKLSSVDETKQVILKEADRIINLFLHVFACRSPTIREELLLAIGALAYAIGPDFGKYMHHFYKYLEMGLQNLEEYQVCAISVAVVGEICRALGDKILPYCEWIMPLLLKCISSDELHWSVKPLIFDCFGDIALAVGEHFEEKYVDSALAVLQRASESSFELDNNDKEMIDYGNQLKRSILECYSLFLQEFKNSKPELMVSRIPHIQRFLESVAEYPRDKSVTKAAVAVLGDLADAFGSNEEVQQLFLNYAFCAVLVEECLESNDEEMKKTAEWTREMARPAISLGSENLF
ncbi:hypothetical protein CASFOL_038979 [Castilleja foliolosa]|uniref:Importin N-terminal domain-containing protein n=1 Tax=Castilleja foliolosa TaxID=1961234 RepID=A0ABD3BIX1_9LAMI